MKFLSILFIAFIASCDPAYCATLAEQVNAMLPGTWARITADNTAYDIDPAKDPALNPNLSSTIKSPPWNGNSGYKAHWDAWNGGFYAENLGPCGSIGNQGGGHMDYWSNHATAINLCGGATGGIKWERLSDPYTGPVYPSVPLPDGLYPNGSPQPSHTFDTIAYIPWRKELLTTAAQVTNTLPQYAKTMAVLDIATRQWVWSAPFAGNQSGTTYVDTKRKLVWLQPFNGTTNVGELASFDPDTRQITYHGLGKTPGVATLDAMGEYDPVRDRLVRTSFRSAPWAIHELDPAYPALGWKLAVQIGQPAVLHGQHAMGWSAARAAWIVWMDKLKTADVHEVKYTGVTEDGRPVYTWTKLTSAANTFNPTPASHPSGGSYSKFQVVRVGCSEVLMGQLRLIDGIAAFRLPGCYADEPPPPPAVPELCAKINAVVCDDFESVATQGTIIKGTQSTPVVKDGKLHIHVPSYSAADGGGSIRYRFPTVKEGDTFAYAYTLKVDKALAENNGPGRKTEILFRYPTSCAGQSLVQSHLGYAHSKLPVAYTECGAVRLSVPIPVVGAGTNYYLHQGDFACEYRVYRSILNGVYPDTCAAVVPDVDIHYYRELTVGHYGVPDSKVQMWVKYGDGPWKQYIDISNFKFATGLGFDAFMLTAYQTARDPLKPYAPGNAWYDKVIAAQQSFLSELRG